VELPLDELMGLALEEATMASTHDDVPIGAVVVGRAGAVIARRHNERELVGDPTAHAELLALRDAATHLGAWRLDGCVLVSTIEPCPMCAGAALAARITTVVFGAPDPKAGACGTLYNLGADPRLNHDMTIIPGIRADEATTLMRRFFAARRPSGAA
jgi:tRNA(adenine34) deaminase